jgi:putative FmdB family regulatory protein
VLRFERPDVRAGRTATEGTVPTYQYACTACNHQLEAVQSFTDDPLTECPVCDGRLRKRFGSVGVVFKGPGFYRTDSRAASNGNGNGKGPSDNGSSGKSKSAESGKDGSSGTKSGGDSSASGGSGTKDKTAASTGSS